MLGSALAHDPKFIARVVAETRAAGDASNIADDYSLGRRTSVTVSSQPKMAAPTKRSHQGTTLGQWLTWQIKPEEKREFTVC